MISIIKNLTYKQQCQYSLYLFGAFLIIIYFSNIKETRALKKTHNLFLERNSEIINPEQQYLNLVNYNKKMDAIIGSNISENINTTELILKYINAFSENHNVKIKEYYTPLLVNNSGYNLKINHFLLEGDFIDLLMLSYLFETKYKLGRLISIEYNIETNKRTKKTSLISHVFLQNITITSDE